MTPGIFKIGGDYSDIANSYSRNVEARRKATDAAFDKYLEQSKSLDPNAVRTQDREAFDEMYDNWKKVGIANKKAIMSDPRVKAGHEKMFRELSRFAQASKKRQTAKEPLMRMYESPDKRSRFNEKMVFSAIDAHEQPLMIKDANGQWVENPNSIEIDYKKNFWNPKPIDLPKFFQDAAFGKKQVENLGTPVRPAKGTAEYSRFEMFRPVKTEYTLETKKEIGNNAFKMTQLTPELEDAFEVELKNISKKDFDELTGVLNQYFPGEELNSAAALAKATALKLAQEQDFEKQTIVKDEERERAERKAERAASEARADRRAGMRGGSPDVNVFDVIDVDLPNPSYSGSLTVPSNKVPAKLLLAMKGLGYSTGFKGVELQVENGKIMSVSPAGFSSFGKPSAPITRDEILIGQQKAGTKIDWGGSKSTKVNKKDRLDLGL